MKERIARQVGVERARHLWMGTFHSIFLRILHAEAAQIGFTSRFTIYDTAVITYGIVRWCPNLFLSLHRTLPDRLLGICPIIYKN